jgi:hypothetical protein
VSLVGMVGGFLWLVAGLEIVLQCPTFSALPNGQTSPCGAVGRITKNCALWKSPGYKALARGSKKVTMKLSHGTSYPGYYFSLLGGR